MCLSNLSITFPSRHSSDPSPQTCPLHPSLEGTPCLVVYNQAETEPEPKAEGWGGFVLSGGSSHSTCLGRGPWQLSGV